ncbi:MAG: DUF4352 domain-containing protein [Halobacteriota archaeon]
MNNKYISIGLILVVILLIVTATSACTSSNRNEATIQASSSASDNPSSTSQTTVRVRVTSLGASQSLTSSYGTPTAAATGNKFVKYAVYLENINGKNLNMGNPYAFTLRDTQGNLYQYDSYTYSLQQQVNGTTLKGLTVQQNTQPGDKYSGLIVFQIPQSATPKSLTYDDYTNKITMNL